MHEEQHLSFAGNNNFGSHLRLLDEAKKNDNDDIESYAILIEFFTAIIKYN